MPTCAYVLVCVSLMNTHAWQLARDKKREKEEGRKRLTELAKHEGRKGDASTRMEVTFEGMQGETGRRGRAQKHIV